MNSVERVKTICKSRKIPISRLEKDLGFSNGYIGQLRKGTFPADRLVAIADYLGTTAEFLLKGEESFISEDIDECAVEYIRELCKQRKIAISTLEKECGFANGYLNPKKLKKIPYDRAIKIANYLNISIGSLFPDIETEKTPTLTEKDERDNLIETKLVELCRELNPEGQEKLVDYAEDLVAGGRYIKSDEAVVGKEA